MTEFFSFRQRLAIEGIMPERALLKLRRAGIDVYNVKKTQKNRILLTVKKKDSEKVFAIYPKVCYNSTEGNAFFTPYVVRPLGAVGVAKIFERAKKRTGFLIGALLFASLTLYADDLVLGVEFKGTSVYARETLAALEEYGVKPYARYRGGNEDMICAKILALDGVEFCSVKKSGMRVIVETQTSPFATRTPEKGDMKAKHDGLVLALTSLRGTPLKSTGDTVKAGETLVGAYFLTPDTSGALTVKTVVDVIARVRIACTYEEDITAESAEEAFAVAYLSLSLASTDEITGKEISPVGEDGGSFHVKIDYTVTETLNF